MKNTSLGAVFTAIVVLSAAAIAQAEIVPGTLVVTISSLDDAVLAIDPVTGASAVISGVDGGNFVGSGSGFSSPESIALDASGNLLVLDGGFADAVVSVDPTTGDRVTISNDTTGSGTPFDVPQSLTVGAGGSIFVTDTSLDAVVAVDPLSGDRIVVSGDDDPNPPVGSGSPFFTPNSIILDSFGNLLVVDAANDEVFSVDPDTGDRLILSQGPNVGNGFNETGSGIGLVAAQSLALDANGTILVVDEALDAVISIDPATGDRTVLSDDDSEGTQFGTGVGFLDPTSIALDEAGNIFVTDEGLDAVVAVDPVTGDRSLLVEFDLPFGGPTSIIVVPESVVPSPVVPEPSACLLIAIGLAAASGFRRSC